MSKTVSIWGAVVVMVVVLARCGAGREVLESATAPEGSEGGQLVAAYHPWWTQDAWRAYPPDLYDEIYFFSVEVDSTGRIAERNGWPDRWFDMQQTLTERGVRVTPVVTLFSQAAFETLFDEGGRAEALRGTLIELLRDSPSAGGLHIDFEIYQGVDASVRGGFTEFVRSLRSGMDAIRPDLRLSVYLVAFDDGDVFDEAALADAVDYFVVQGYDLHARGEDRTGPVAALDGWGRRNWRAVADRLLDLGVSPHKIVMSVPYFGYEWPAASGEPGARTTGRGRTISVAAVDSVNGGPPSALAQAERHGLRRDPVSGSPFYAFQDSTDVWRQGWFEDEQSLEAKYRFVVREGLGGVAVFPPAYGTPGFDALLARVFSQPSGRNAP